MASADFTADKLVEIFSHREVGGRLVNIGQAINPIFGADLTKFRVLKKSYFDDHKKFLRYQDIDDKYFETFHSDDDVRKHNREHKEQMRFMKVHFISHRWETPAHPDPNATQFEMIRRELSKGYSFNVFYDYSCMPQQPRSAQDEVFFKWCLHNLNNLINQVGFLAIPSDDYYTRSWCLAELMCCRDPQFLPNQYAGAKYRNYLGLLETAYYFLGIKDEETRQELRGELIKAVVAHTECTNGGDKALISGILQSFCNDYFKQEKSSHIFMAREALKSFKGERDDHAGFKQDITRLGLIPIFAKVYAKRKPVTTWDSNYREFEVSF